MSKYIEKELERKPVGYLKECSIEYTYSNLPYCELHVAKNGFDFEKVYLIEYIRLNPKQFKLAQKNKYFNKIAKEIGKIHYKYEFKTRSSDIMNIEASNTNICLIMEE